MNVAIIGTGYVGLTTGACLAFLGHRVTCVDTDENKIAELERGGIPIYEPYLKELIAASRANLVFTTSYAQAIPDAQVVFIAVGTPPGQAGAPDLRYLKSSAHSVGQLLGHHFTVVVNKSTVPIGSGNWVGSLVRQAVSGRTDDTKNVCFAVASNPEFLREGTAIADTLYADRIVVGADEPQTAEVLYTLYRPILDQTFQEPVFLPGRSGWVEYR